jgi:hypothetical protein
MISKYFWPAPIRKGKNITNSEALKRGEYLRDLIGLKDDSLLKERNLRNHLEHFDERLDYWGTLNLPYMNNIVIPRRLIGKALTGKIEKANSFNFYDSEEHIYEVCHDQFNIRKIMNEVKELYDSVSMHIPRPSILTSHLAQLKKQ